MTCTNDNAGQVVEGLILSKEKTRLDELIAINDLINVENDNYLVQKYHQKLSQAIVESDDPFKHISNTVRLCSELICFCFNEKKVKSDVEVLN